MSGGGGAGAEGPYRPLLRRAGGVRRGREVAAQGPAREAHEVAGAAAVAGAEAARAALRAGQRRQRAGELALPVRPVDQPGALGGERREQVVGVPAQRLLRARWRATRASRARAALPT